MTAQHATSAERGDAPPAGVRPANAADRPAGVATTNARRAAGLALAITALAVCVVASLMLGSKAIAPGDVFQALAANDGSNDAFIVRDLRVPRAVLGLLVGAALGVAGALIQALTRNPLADPGILGVNGGAAFAVTLGIGVFGVTSIGGYVWFAFAGAIVVTVLVYVLGSIGPSGATPIRLVLVGVAMGAILQGVTTGMSLLDPNTFDALRGWRAGSIAGRDWEVIGTVLPFILAGLLIALVASRPLNAIALGDDLARSLGAKILTTRVLVLVAVTLLAGAATAAAGPIIFVGLMVPHVVRWLVGPDQRWIVVYSIVLAPILVLASDVLGRVVLPPQELQVGVITAFVGAPVLILLARRSKASGL